MRSGTFAEVQARPSGCQQHRVAREARVGARVEAPTVPKVHSRSSRSPKIDRAVARFDAGSKHVGEHAAPRGLSAPRADRRSRSAGSRGCQMPTLESTRVSGPLLNGRSNSSAARRVPPHVSGTESRSPMPSRSTRAHPSAVGEAVAVGVVEDRQEHQLAAAPARPPGTRRARRDLDATDDVDARPLVHQQHDRDVARRSVSDR